jgi:SAM-dependent methyltransferase
MKLSRSESEFAAEPPVLPPGTILQHIYIRKRLRDVPPGRFVEVGTGDGLVSRLLLDLGWSGSGWDLNQQAIEHGRALNATYVEQGRYELHHGDWFAAEASGTADLVVSMMVLEHLDDDAERQYFDRAAAELVGGGRLILLVPGSPDHWGIEDEIAGHMRRYTRASLDHLVKESGWEVEYLVGLTWPISNLLLRISNRLVRRSESDRLALDFEDRTIASGHRQVAWKTRFPRVMRLALNEWTMRPLHLAQVAGSGKENALVLYCECRVARSDAESAAVGTERARNDVVSASTTRRA